MDRLTVLLHIESAPATDTHTLQLFVIRLFNIAASALKLALSGYYQPAYQLLRDMLEIGNLVDLFGADRRKISEWRMADNQKLKKDFGPAAVRKALSALPQFQAQDRGSKYALLSRHASHVTYIGFQLLSPNNSPQLGPFVHEKFLRAVLEDEGMHLSHAVFALDMLFPQDESVPHLQARLAFTEGLKKYREKYISGARTEL
jgi:hypothetical protein